MTNSFYSVSHIENFFYKLLTDVSSHVFLGDLPARLDASWGEMIVIDVNNQSDKGSHSFGSVNILVYSRPKGQYLVKNVAVQNKICNAIEEAIASSDNSHYTMSINWRATDYDSTRNLHCNVINISLLIT